MSWTTYDKLDLNNWTKADFANVPRRNWDEDIGEFMSVVLVPVTEGLFKQIHAHDSGYGCIDLIAVKGENKHIQMVRCGGGDAIHLNGIGGRGPYMGSKTESTGPKAFNMDLLLTSGYLRLWCHGSMSIGLDLSSMEIYSK